MKKMKSIQAKQSIELTIKNSRFIGLLLPLSKVEDFEALYQETKETYKDANHYCYAYIVGDNQEQQKYSDDGEPSQTAGLPMLEVLKKHDVTNILAITIRYFGGIKLGASGLIRAYAKSVSENIKNVTYTSKQSFTSIEVTIPFDHIGHVEHFLRSNYTLDDTTYDTHVHYFLELESSLLNDLKDTLQERTNGVAILTAHKQEERYV